MRRGSDLSQSDYLAALRQANEGLSEDGLIPYGLGPGDNPIFKGVYDWSLWVAGATLQAGECVANGERETAFNLAGGLHHAQPSRASGFCYINDVVVGISKLIQQGNRVVYIDIDATTVTACKMLSTRQTRFSPFPLHQSGYTLFPGTGTRTKWARDRAWGTRSMFPSADDG